MRISIPIVFAFCVLSSIVIQCRVWETQPCQWDYETPETHVITTLVFPWAAFDTSTKRPETAAAATSSDTAKRQRLWKTLVITNCPRLIIASFFPGDYCHIGPDYCSTIIGILDQVSKRYYVLAPLRWRRLPKLYYYLFFYVLGRF